MNRPILAAALAVSAVFAGCATPASDGPLLAESDKRECRTGTIICRKPNGSISEVRTVSGDAVPDAGGGSGSGSAAAKPKPGQQ